MPFLSTKRQVIVQNLKQALDMDARNMCDERKAWFAKGGGIDDDETKDLLTILSEFSDPPLRMNVNGTSMFTVKGNIEATGDDKLTDDEIFAQIKCVVTNFVYLPHYSKYCKRQDFHLRRSRDKQHRSQLDIPPAR